MAEELLSFGLDSPLKNWFWVMNANKYCEKLTDQYSPAIINLENP
jgi:hypothetical protein